MGGGAGDARNDNYEGGKLLSCIRYFDGVIECPIGADGLVS